MHTELARMIEQVSREKGIDRRIVIAALESAMMAAAKRRLESELRRKGAVEGESGIKVEAKYNPQLGDMELFRNWIVVEKVENPAAEISLEDARKLDPEAMVGDELLERLDPKYGRLEASAARQHLAQRLRDAERERIYNEFRDRKGELTHSGIVQRFERRNIIVNLGKTDAILPEKEQIPRERYRQGDRIRALILDVDPNARGPQVILSRTHPDFLVKLFEQEVPEIYEGIVEIKAAAREPGGRAKIAVVSHDRDVDPVGACVGMRGTRVQAVVQELRGEKIDIVPWSPDPGTFVARALAPAAVSKIVVDDEEHAMEVIVPDDQLSLAIGKRGQNVRLASKLTGWKIDVKSESGYEDEARRAREALRQIPGVNEVIAELLFQHGFKSAREVAAAGEEGLAEVEGLPPDRIAPVLEGARVQAENERRAAEEAAEAAASAEAEEAVATEEPMAAAQGGGEASGGESP